MGSLASVVGAITQIGSNRNKSLQIEAANRQAEQNAAIKRQQNLLSYQASETARTNTLRQRVATQRARSGAQGTGDDAGSSEAVIAGYQESSDIDRQEHKRRFDLDNQAIDQNLVSQKQINLLQRQQLKQNTFLGILGDQI